MAETPLFVEVIINGYHTGKIGEFTQRDGALFAQAGELRDLGIRVPSTTPSEREGVVALSALAGLTWRLDQPSQTLYLTAPRNLLFPERLASRESSLPRLPVESGTGASLNYDVIGTRTPTGDFSSGSFDGRIFSPWGVLSTNGLVSSLPDPNGVRPYTLKRLDSTYTYSDPNALRRYRLGDFISGGLGWSRPVRLGGGQISADFSLRPDLVTMPLPIISSSVAVPSTVDVLVNGVRVFTSEVPPGPFEIPQIPIVSGSNDISLAVTNALGKQITTTLPFYAGGGLLAPGLQSFSVEAGKVRRNYGIASNDYGDGVGSATWRRGLTNYFTAEVHAEGGSQWFMGGGGGVVKLGNLAVLNFGAAGSEVSGRRGSLASVGASRISRLWSIAASLTRADRDFSDIAALNFDPVPTRRLSLSTGLSLARFGSLGLAYNEIERPATPAPIAVPNALTTSGAVLLQPAQHARLLSASYSLQMGKASMYATAFRNLDEDTTTNTNTDSRGAMLGLTLPLGVRSSASVSGGKTSGSGSGGTTSESAYGQIQANQSAVAIGDFGYQLFAQRNEVSHQFAQVSYKSPWARLSVGADRVEDQTTSQTTSRLEVQGAITLTAGSLFLSNTIYDAFAVVDTNGFSGIDVLRENQKVGKTDTSGQLLVPDLRAFGINHLAIDPNDVPVDATLASPTRDVRPQDRSGVVVQFPIRRSRSALLRVVSEGGVPIPMGSIARLLPNGVNVPVGYDGELFIQELKALNTVAIDEPDGKRCTTTFKYVARPGEIPTIGPLICRRDKP